MCKMRMEEDAEQIQATGIGNNFPNRNICQTFHMKGNWTILNTHEHVFCFFSYEHTSTSLRFCVETQMCWPHL